MSSHTVDVTEAAQRVVLDRTMRGLWAGLPALLTGSVVLCLAAGLALLLGGGLTPWSLLLLALLAGAPMMALAEVCHDIVIEDDTTIRRWHGALRQSVRIGTGLLLVPTVFAALLMVAIEVHHQTGSSLWLAPMAVSASATLGSTFALLGAVPAAVARPELRGWALWATAAHIVGRWPVRFLAALSVLGLGLWAGLTVTGTLLPLVPGPVLLLATAAFWSSAVQLGATDLQTSSNRISDERTATS